MFYMIDKYRDPVHGFIEVRSLENEIINSMPFQRLRNIKQLAMTYLVFHGAEHTRFGHSLGVMHLVSNAFRSAISNGPEFLSKEKKDWYEQILRLIALLHDIGHAPFSHASESVFPDGTEHEDYTEKIIKETCIADIISKIGTEYKAKYGKEYDITPELICDIYMRRIPGENSEFVFLSSFMDGELDCDKMDYLLRDSLYCGVNYGKYDVQRLISCLTVYREEGGSSRLAVKYGGVQAFEEFVLARYFMFVQVYFHRTRRYFDIMLKSALEKILDNGKYPENIEEYLSWDDCKVIELMKEKCDSIKECDNIVNRKVYAMVLDTKTHPEEADKREFRMMRNILYEKFGRNNFIEDQSADKMPHKIPIRTAIDDEKAIVIINERTGKNTTISEESQIISSLTNKINIQRIYANKEYSMEAEDCIRSTYKDII